MRRHVPLARPDYSLDSVAAVLLEDGSPAVVVVDAMLRAIGVVTRSDVLRFWDAQRYGEPRPPSREHAARLALAGMRITHLVGATALDVMSPIVETLPANTTIVEGAATLTRLGVEQVVVIGADSLVAGLLTARDVVRWVAETQWS